MALTKLTSNLIEGGTGTDWVTAIQTSNFTAAAGKGYFVNTTSQVLYVTLPVGVVGMEITIQDYAGTFATNKVILNANGSEKIQGSALEGEITTNNATAVLIYQDATKGWTSQDVTIPIPLTVDYLVIAGGGGGGRQIAGGGGGGGIRTSYTNTSTLNGHSESSLTLVTATPYLVTIGGGGGGGTDLSTNRPGANGVNSTFSNITSTAGGGGGGGGGDNGNSGGSGGGGSYSSGTGGSAVTSPVTQGYAGGSGTSTSSGTQAGGGGASAIGQNGGSSTGGNGGAGLAVNILNATNAAAASVGEVSGSDVYYSGGGGGSGRSGSSAHAGTGGIGGGTDGTYTNTAPSNANPNTGGGGGGSGYNDSTATSVNGANGGSGVVILRYPSSYTVSGLTEATGSPFTEGTSKVSVFTAGTGNIQFN